jgi:polysaccharide biosynthesis/export protein
MRKKNGFSILLLLSIIISSCASSKKYVYFNSSEIKNEQQNNFNPKLKSGDLLMINVYSSNLETSIPFNLPLPNTSVRAGYNNGIAANTGYLINQNGEIDFPILGKLNLMNLTTIEASQLIKEKLEPYLSNPIINIQIQNFKITVLGEVKNPGTYQIPNERISLTEALGLAGDLTINGVRSNITLIRDYNGVKKEIILDLTSKEIFNSEYYYLSQNDVIYISPNQAKINSSTMSTSYGMFISIASLLITTINVLTK